MTRATRLPATMSATQHFTDAESSRVRRLAADRGHNRARLLLGVSEGVMLAALDCGRVWTKTRDRVVAKLDEIETEQAKGATA